MERKVRVVNPKNESRFSVFISLLIFIIAFWGVTYTTDWNGYEMFYETGLESRDLAFDFLSEKFRDMGLDYRNLYQFHIILIASLYIVFFHRVSNKTLLLVLFCLLTNYVAIGNQIRFFVAFPLALLATHKFVMSGIKNKVLSCFLMVLSVLFHFSMIIYYALFFSFYYFLERKSVKIQIISIVLGNIVLLYLLSYSSLIDDQYVDYFEKSHLSSFSGGLLTAFPAIFSWCLVFRFRLLSHLNNSVLYEDWCKFLYVSSISTSMILFAGLSMQVFISRFILTVIPLCILYLLYGQEVCSSAALRSRTNSYILSIVLVSLASRYLFPFVLGIFPEYCIYAIEMLTSYTFPF